MSNIVPGHLVGARAVVASLCLALAAGGGALAQAEVRPAPETADPSLVPGVAEVALCQMPELGERAGSAGLTASIADTPLPASAARAHDGPLIGGPRCRLPSVDMPDVLDSGAPIAWYATNDLAGDGPGSLDIQRVLHTMRSNTSREAGRVLSDKAVLKSGKVTRKLLTGNVYLVCVELEEELKAGDSVVIGTDVEGDPSRRAPSGVEVPDNPLANVRDLYHLARRDDGSVFAGATDLATNTFYASKRPFAAWLEGTKAYFVIPRKGMGDDFRVVAFRSGEGNDIAGLGATPRIPSDGEAGWIEECIAHALFHEPLVIDEVEVSFSRGEVQFCFAAADEDLERIEEWLDLFGLDGIAKGEMTFRLREAEASSEQTVPVDVYVDDGLVYFLFPIGYRAYGYHAVEAVEDLRFDSTGDVQLDTLFSEAARTIERALNPVTFAEDAGFLQGRVRCVDPPPAV